MKSLAKSPPRVEFVCDDPNLTPAAGLATVFQLDRVLGIIAVIDERSARSTAPMPATSPSALASW